VRREALDRHSDAWHPAFRELPLVSDGDQRSVPAASA
jgi:hypothetical protein